MAEEAKVRIDLNSKADLKGFKQIESASQKLTKNVKKLGAAFGVAFSIQAGKNAVKAFAADDKAAKTLSRTLNNLGLAFADPAAKQFIGDLERQFGVLDDQLRPAFQKLLTTTANFTKSQDLLKTALDLSALSGIDVVSVSDDLAKAFAGNTRGLLKYGLGISKADLATMSFDEILQKVAKVSAGQAAAAADELSGSLAKLQVATSNAQESLGKDLVNALTTLGGAGGLPKTLGLIESISSALGDAIIGIARLANIVNIITGSGSPVEMVKRLGAFRKEYQAADQAEKALANTAFKSHNAKAAADKLAINNANTLTKVTKSQAAAELAKAKAKKDQAALDKAALALAKGADVFDMDRIQLNAALMANQEALNKLGGAGTEQQRLGLANDLVRLTIKQDMLLLEDAIAAKDVAGATALAAKLNKDLAILGVLQGQNIKLLEINTILEAFKPKDLINLDNLNKALALLMAMAGVKISPLVTAQATAIAAPIVAGITFNPQQNKDRNYDNNVLMAAATMASNQGIPGVTFNPNQNKDRNYGTTVVNVSAGVIAQMDEFTALVQRAIQTANRNGNNLDVAGIV